MIVVITSNTDFENSNYKKQRPSECLSNKKCKKYLQKWMDGHVKWADPGFSKGKEGAPMSTEGTSFLGGSGGMLSQKFLKI